MLDARATLAAAALGGRATSPASLALLILKRMYSTMLGGMLNAPDHNPTAYLRPDWAWMVKAAAAASMWRQLCRLEHPPAAVLAPDAALFIGPEPPALTYSGQHGKWKLERAGQLDTAMRDAIRRGQPGRLILALRRNHA